MCYQYWASQASMKHVGAIVCENSMKFKMAAIMKRSQIFEIGENSIKLQSLFFHLSPHLNLYVLPVLSIVSEFEVCPGL